MWDQSPIFKRLYEAEYGQFGGEPFGCVVGDYYFDHSPPDVDVLTEMAKVCAAAHCPFIAGTAPTLMRMASWQELAGPRHLTNIFTLPEYEGWRAFRASDDARFVCLAMPRVLARLPYGARTDPIEEFAFEEEERSTSPDQFVWTNAAYLMAVNINRAFKQYGWCARIRGLDSGGIVERLPTHTFPSDDGGVSMKCSTELSVQDRLASELAGNGLMPLVHRKNSDYAVFLSAQSLQQPPEHDDPDAAFDAALAAQLPYTLACCRFLHYIKCIVRDKIGSFIERDDMQRWLARWIVEYVDGDPDHSTEDMKARRPLRFTEVDVDEVEGQPGYYLARLSLQPHHQLESLNAPLVFVTRLPSAKGIA